MTGTLEPCRGSTVTTTCTATPVDDASWATTDHRPLASAATARSAPAIRWGFLIEASLENSSQRQRQRYPAEMKPVNARSCEKKSVIVATVALPKFVPSRAAQKNSAPMRHQNWSVFGRFWREQNGKARKLKGLSSCIWKLTRLRCRNRVPFFR